MSRKKGNSRERQCRDCYESAGYTVEKSVSERYGRTDFWGHWDLMASRPDDFRFIQVKSEAADGIAAANAWAREHAPPWVRLDFAVVYKREGWRLIRLWPEADTHTTVVDERETAGTMGEDLTRYLAKGEDDA